jgi:hypothetical protein
MVRGVVYGGWLGLLYLRCAPLKGGGGTPKFVAPAYLQIAPSC